LADVVPAHKNHDLAGKCSENTTKFAELPLNLASKRRVMLSMTRLLVARWSSRHPSLLWLIARRWSHKPQASAAAMKGIMAIFNKTQP
jgi:hypothetical protein